MRPGTRGRPLKFGRPARVLALTLPDDVVGWLKRIHPDPGWAIVSLFERMGRSPRRQPGAPAQVELAQLSGQQNLIVVDPRSFRSLPGVAVVPVAAGRAFLALEEGRNSADLELAILDRIQDPGTELAERKTLRTLLHQVRGWRRSRDFIFSTRTIIIVEKRRRRRRS